MSIPNTMLIRSVPLLLALLPFTLRAQVNTDDKRPSRSAESAPAAQEEKELFDMAPARDASQGAWSITDTRATAERWKAVSAARPADVNACFNWLRSERTARLSANNGVLSNGDRTALKAIADQIDAAAPGSFEQHLGRYYLVGPSREAFPALLAAEALRPDRPELILPMLQRANMDGDTRAMDQWCARLEKNGDLAPALRDVAHDLLQSVSRNGIVFINGDLDGAPALALQRIHDTRRDVLIIDQRLLMDPAYRQRIWREARASGPVPGGGADFAVKMAAATQRTLFLALSLDRGWFDAFSGRLCPMGIAFRVGDAEACTTTEQYSCWSSLRKPMAAGPLSHNYLLPGSVLLRRYRAEGNEERASLLEHELRGMANALGSTTELINAGVLLH